LRIFTQDRMLHEVSVSAPDYGALVHRDTPEYGLPLFGRDYGGAFLAWLQHDYRRVARWGAAPLRPERLRDGRSGFEVYRRVAPSPASSRKSSTSTTP